MPVYLLCVDADGTNPPLRKGATYTLLRVESCPHCGAGPYYVVAECLGSSLKDCVKCRGRYPTADPAWLPRRFVRLNEGDPITTDVEEQIVHPVSA